MRATAPESRSSEPPLEFFTRAMALRVKTACSPLRSPTNLKSSRVTVTGGGFDAAWAAVARMRMQRSEKNLFIWY